jgi:hypothetical protein
LAVGILHVVAGSVGEEVTVNGGSRLLGSASDRSIYMKGEKGEQSNREYSSEVLAILKSRNYATYALYQMNWG